MENGLKAEFGTPRDLLEKEVGHFKTMVFDNGQAYYDEMMGLIANSEAYKEGLACDGHGVAKGETSNPEF
jgi:hypothetical protein